VSKRGIHRWISVWDQRGRPAVAGHRAQHILAGVLLSVGPAVGPAAGAPHLVSEADLFDHLSTTFPIEDWILHARNRYDACERKAHESGPRAGTRCWNLPAGIEAAVESVPLAEALVWRRADRCRDAVGLLGGPCERMATRGMSRPGLPDRPGFASVSLVLPGELDGIVGGN
jgi:hypothetical protein